MLPHEQLYRPLNSDVFPSMRPLMVNCVTSCQAASTTECSSSIICTVIPTQTMSNEISHPFHGRKIRWGCRSGKHVDFVYAVKSFWCDVSNCHWPGETTYQTTCWTSCTSERATLKTTSLTYRFAVLCNVRQCHGNVHQDSPMCTIHLVRFPYKMLYKPYARHEGSMTDDDMRYQIASPC